MLYYIATLREATTFPFRFVIWDLDDDPHGNVRHCAEHNVTQDEVEWVLQNGTDELVSQSSGVPLVFGDTAAGRHIVVAYEAVDQDTAYPITAYDVPRG